MIRKFITIFGSLGIVVLFIGFIGLMGSMRPKVETKPVELAPPAVFYATAEAQPVTLDVRAQGEVRPRTDITLTAQVAGKIVRTSTEFLDGGAFNEGDLLIKIEDADYQVALAGAKARVAQAEEALRREEAESALARRDYEDLGRREDPTDLALRLPQLAQARANFEAARAEQRAAQLNLDRTEIRAPFKGRVRTRLVGEGQYVAPGAQLARIFSTDVAEIRLPLTDGDLAKLGLPISFVETEDNPGPPAHLSAVVAGDLHEWSGRVARTDGAIDPATRQISAIVTVDDPYGAGADDGMPLAIGLYVDAVVEGKPFEHAIVLPRTALYGRDIVYVILPDNTLDERKVVVVSADRDTITLASGVNPGERVATSPLRGATAGGKVTPTDPNDIAPKDDDAAASTGTPVADAGGSK
ncbi:MAG: efflux RND transporter periplasmic adaptor subunit [Pseudomonadota bacterium]|nr:efflux RND transporter periplasmic adaptor subunit [Pseudomonadota bacterium]